MEEISLSNCWQQCCKSYSIQEVLEAAQAGQHFKSCFQLVNLFVRGLFCLGILFLFLFFLTKLCESFWISMMYLGMLNPDPCLLPISASSGRGVLASGKNSISTSLAIATWLCSCCSLRFSPSFIFHLFYGKVVITLTHLPHGGVVRTS